MKLSRQQILILVGAAMIAVVAAVVTAYFVTRDDGAPATQSASVRTPRPTDTAVPTDFFIASTERPCTDSMLDISLNGARFAAFVAGAPPAPRGSKYAVIDITLSNRGTAPLQFDVAHFAMADAPGRRYDAVPAAPISPEIGPAQPVSGQLLFSIPSTAGAEKLSYDDGCLHQEWIVP